MKIKSIVSVILALILTFVFTACSFAPASVKYTDPTEESTKPNEPSLNLAVLKNNAASLGLVELMDNAANNDNNYNISISNNPDEIFTLLDSGKIDVATLPLISAIRYYNSGKTPIKMLYSASYITVKTLSTSSNIKSVRDFSNHKVYMPGKNTIESATTELLLNYQQAYYTGEITPDFEYTKDNNDLLSAIEAGKVKTCVVTEPLATQILEKYPDFTLRFEPDDSYTNITFANAIQDCVIITEKYLEDHPEAVETFLTRCKTSIVYSNYNNYSAGELAELYQLVESADLAMKMIQNSKIIFVDASVADSKNRSYFSSVHSTKFDKDTLFAGYPPEKDFYYR